MAEEGGRESYVISLETQQFLEGADAIIRKFENIEGISQEAGKIIDAVLKSSKPSENFKKALDELKKKIDEYTKKLKDAEEAEKSFQSNSDNTAGTDNQEESVEQLAVTLNELQGIYKTVASASQQFQKACEESAQAQEEQTDAMDKSATAMQKFIGGQEQYNDILNVLPQELSNAIRGIDGMTTASLKFIATPLGVVLGGLALVLASLYSYFKNTEEGEAEFVRISGYATGVVNQLNDALASLGKDMYHIFDSPTAALEHFGDLLYDVIFGRFIAIGKQAETLKDALVALFSGDFSTDTWESLGKRWVDNVASALTSQNKDGFTDKLIKGNELAIKNADLEARQKVVDDFRNTKWKVKEEEINRKVENLKGQISTTSDPKKKIELEAQAQEILNQKYKMKIALAQEDLKIQQEKMELTNNTAADYAKEAELQANLIRLEGDRMRDARFFERKEFSAQQTLANQAMKNAKELAKEQADAAKEKNNLAILDLKAQEAASRELRKAAIETELMRAQGLKEGHEKTMKLIELHAEQELLAFQEQKDNALLAKISRAKQAFDADSSNKGKIFDMGSVVFTPEEKKQWDDREKAINEKNDRLRQEALQKEKDAMNKYLIQYGTYQERKQAISEKYEQLRLKAETKGDTKILDKQEEAELEKLNKQFGLATTAFADLFADASTKSVNEIQKIIDKYEMLVDFMQGGGLTEGEVGIDENGKKRKKTKVTRDDLLNAGFTEKDLANLTPEQIEKISKALKGLHKDLSNKSPWEAFIESMDEAIKKLQEGDLAGGIDGMCGAIKAFMPYAKQFANSLDNIFGGNNGSSIDDAVQGLEGLVTTGQSFAQFASGDYIGGAMSLANGLSTVKDAISNLVDRKHERKIKQLQDYIDNLEDAYGDLERAVSKTYSKARQTNIEAEISNKQAQINAIQKQIQEERDKKKTDNSRISEWQSKIKDLQNEISDLRDEAKDAIFGSDIQTAIQNFADAYTSAWENGTSTVRTARQQVRELMKAMVNESIKSALQSSEAMQKIRDKLAEFWADEYLSQSEQDFIENMADNLQNELNSKYGWADRLFKDDYTQSGTSKGFATASQDSVDELNGRFTAVQMNTNSLVQSVAVIQMQSQQQVESLSSIRQSVEQTMHLSREGINHLAQIEKYTSNLVQMNERLDQIERNTRAL